MMLRGRVALKRAVAGARSMAAVHGVTPLAEHDPAMNSLLQQEAERQKGGLELIGKSLICLALTFFFPPLLEKCCTTILIESLTALLVGVLYCTSCCSAKEWIDSQYVFGGLYVHYNPRRDAKHHS